MPLSDQHFLFFQQLLCSPVPNNSLTPQSSLIQSLFHFFYLAISLLIYFPLYATYILLSTSTIILSIIFTWGNPYLLWELPSLPVPVPEELSPTEDSTIAVLADFTSYLWPQASAVKQLCLEIMLFLSLVCILIFWDDFFIRYTLTSNLMHTFSPTLVPTPCRWTCFLLYWKKIEEVKTIFPPPSVQNIHMCIHFPSLPLLLWKRSSM